MTGSRSAAQEASDPSTSPERLLELTEKHPQLQRLIVLNPSCPNVAREWILATNPWAKTAYEQAQQTPQVPLPEDDDEDAGEPTALHQVVPEQPAPAAPPVPADPDGASPWGDFGDEDIWAGADSTSEPAPAPPAPSVRISQDAGVVPLGPAPAADPSPAPAPAPAMAPGPAPAGQEHPDHTVPAVAGATAAQVPSAAPAPEPAPAQDEGSGPSRRAWFACGGCLLLALVLLVVMALAGRAWLSADDDGYERDSSTTAQETPSEEASDEAPEETPSPDPVSPAPDDAHEMTELRSPTGNISCMLEEGTVSCSLEDRDFSEAGLEDCQDGPFSLQVSDGEAATACGSSFLSDSARTLEYEESAVHGDMACTSRFDGMTCWNTMTGKGFTANKVTYETF